jgi:hypothetical protein
VFKDGITDRFGDLKIIKASKPPRLGPGEYNKEKYGFDQLAE